MEIKNLFHEVNAGGYKFWFLNDCPHNIAAYVKENKRFKLYGRFDYTSHVRVEKIENNHSFDQLVGVNTRTMTDESGWDTLEEALEHVASMVEFERAS